MLNRERRLKEKTDNTPSVSNNCYVLTDSAMSFEPFKIVAIPKSPSLTNPDLVRKILSVLMSLQENKEFTTIIIIYRV